MHFDLCILHKNNNKRIPILVLENKVKSIPENDQLTKYYNIIKPQNNNICFILLTLIDNFIDKSSIEDKWIVVTYKDLAHFLKSINHPINPYIFYILDDYRRFIYLLNNLKDNWTVSDTYLLCKKTKDDLSNLRIDDLAQKLQVNRLYLELTNRLKSIATRQQDTLFWKTNKSNHYIKIGIGYSNKSALLDIVVFLDKIIDISKKKDNINTLHIQLQGSQYRHAYEFEISNNEYQRLKILNSKNKKYSNEVLKIAEPFIARNSLTCWINNPPNDKNSILCGDIKPSNSSYNSFKGQGKDGRCSLFIYQYFTINDNSTIACIVDLLFDDINDLLSKI